VVNFRFDYLSHIHILDLLSLKRPLGGKQLHRAIQQVFIYTALREGVKDEIRLNL